MAPRGATIVPPRELNEELQRLRNSLITWHVIGLFGIYWLWYLSSFPRGAGASTGEMMTPADHALLVSSLGFVCFFLLKPKHFRLATLAFTLLFSVSIGTAYDSIPYILFLSMGMILAAFANLSRRGTGGVQLTTISWGVQVTMLSLRAQSLAPIHESVGLLAMYYLISLLIWVAYHPVELVSIWMFDEWTRARDALGQARHRQEGLNRTVRALEEALYRLERMNNELMITRDRAEGAKASKARFAAVLSHELRGPLNLILGFSRLMVLSPESYGETLPVAYRADVDTIYSSSQHLVTLLDDILDLSQIEADHMPLIKDRISIGEEVIDKSVAIAQPLLDRKGLQLRLDIEGGLPPVMADGIRLRQVLLNLLTNAARFTDKGCVTVSARSQADGVLVSVQDTGRGISPHDMTRLFREFEQLGLPHDELADRSTGLGLAVSRQFVQLHGGRMWADSQQGVGTTIHFSVPSADDGAGRWQTLRSSQRVPGARPRDTCLVVHGDPAIVRLLARHIEGYRIVGVPGKTGVVAATRELHPKAVVTASAEAADVIRQLEAASVIIPVIACGIPDSLVSQTRDGICAYLMKPVTPEMVRVVMQHTKPDRESTILLVDDDPDAVRLLEALLTALPRPYRILTAYSGLQALETMRKETPDIVFMDVLMPEVDGMETIARMRDDLRLKDVPIAIVSARDPSENPPVIEAPITLHYHGSLEFKEGCDLLKNMLDAITPNYAPDSPGPPEGAAVS